MLITPYYTKLVEVFNYFFIKTSFKLETKLLDATSLLVGVIGYILPAPFGREVEVSEELRGVKEVESWLSPSQAGAMLGTSGQWVTQLARRGELDAVRTSLGWLVNPADVERLANERLKKAEQKISAMKSARSAGVSGVRNQRAGRGRARLGGSANG
ncbi:MAG: hypothetical protein CYG60_17120 [Actinobacteria bacterium]|nr:MAG: hypothetical protein CYG60_17120 [Actinomycetota bacterium]